jgi:hypothetical protein
VIAKAGNLAILFLYANDQPGQHAHGVPQKARIGRWVDIALNAGTIGSNLTPLFNSLVLGIAQQIAVDEFPRRVADSFDLAVEGRFLKTFLSDSNPAKAR